jgi:hypothetical protein
MTQKKNQFEEENTNFYSKNKYNILQQIPLNKTITFFVLALE